MRQTIFEFCGFTAHCVFEIGVPSKLSFHIGRIHLTDDSEYTQKFNAEDVILHPDFKGTRIDNDIALIKLAGKIKLTKSVAVRVKSSARTERSLGLASPKQKLYRKKTLEQTLVDVVDALTCISSDCDVLGIQLTTNMICARGQEGACSGDSGGGMFFKIKDSWLVRGIASFTTRKIIDGLCDPSVYTVYTDRAKYMAWIADARLYNR
ncbi:vitamin K-dependent protein C-like [Anopheles maculipalpis]|uniref:vitamin K-dependent protein C-like n=1 Tax=Anopheles maculipalpis TaxID=1496333 RepID=UPI0021593DE9|nr:vitamin K-dependent protein C-like [Anopheles maculipalpis]